MKDQVNLLAATSRSISNSQFRHGFEFQNRIVYKCKKQRGALIQREVSNLIKKQILVLNATKKIQKQIDVNHKDVVYIEQQTPIQRVHRFRKQQKQKQWQKLKNYKAQNQQRMKLLASRISQRSLDNKNKSSQNFARMIKVHKRFKQTKMKQTFNNQDVSEDQTSRLHTSKTNKSLINSNSKMEMRRNRVSLANQKCKQKQSMDINNFLSKMKNIEERKIKKQLELDAKKLQHIKVLPKCNIAMRIQKQEQLVNQWSQQYQHRFQKFQKNRAELVQQKDRMIYQKSLQKSMVLSQILNRKNCSQEQLAQKRIALITNKMKKINKVPGRQQKYANMSKQNFNHNINKVKQDSQKQQHSILIRKIYQIMQKLEKMSETQKLNQNQIDFLLQNLDIDSRKQQYKQIIRYINSSKEKFFQQKRKQ